MHNRRIKDTMRETMLIVKIIDETRVNLLKVLTDEKKRRKNPPHFYLFLYYISVSN